MSAFETRKAGSLLAYLALGMQKAHARDVLAELLWPDEDLDSIRNRLRQALSSLRRVLEPDAGGDGTVLRADRNEVRLNPDVVTTDVGEFEEALRSAQRSDETNKGSASLETAIRLYQGELLEGYYESWITLQRERFGQEYLAALGTLADYRAEQGDSTGAIDLARRAVGVDNLREDLHCKLIRLYAAAGRTADALRQYKELERLLRDELGIRPTAVTQSVLDELRMGSPATSMENTPDIKVTAPRSGRIAELEPDGGAVPLDSPFYIVRPTDSEFDAAVMRQDSIVLVKGARQMGKTSLLARGIQRAREAGFRVVLSDLQSLTADQLQSADRLFWSLAEALSEELDLGVCVDDFWDSRRGWNVNFERFLRLEVLGKSETPVLWALDEVDRLFTCPFSADVFGLFRSWHNARSLNPSGPWGKLTIAISYATEAHLFITDLNQSPFNVGTRLTLEDFRVAEVSELNRRYGSPLRDDTEITRFYGIVGGNPYLARRGLHTMVSDGLDIPAFEARSVHEDGPFSDHLRRMLAALTQDSALCDAVRELLAGKPCPSPESFYRLRSAGVLMGTSAEDARPRCGLYRSYLESHL